MKLWPNILKFDPQRFLNNKELAKDPAYRPFGGGSQYCSGRFLARRGVVGFLAFVLDRFNIGVKTQGETTFQSQKIQQFPRLGANKPNIGVISPIPGDDIFLSIKH